MDGSGCINLILGAEVFSQIVAGFGTLVEDIQPLFSLHGTSLFVVYWLWRFPIEDEVYFM